MGRRTMNEQDKIEAENLLNEIQEQLETCIKCGMCKSLCPMFKTLREEALSPRGKAILLSEKILDKIVYKCTLCKACELNCPLNLKITDSIRKAREVLVLKNKDLKENKEMIENIRKTGNPFGKNPDEKGKLYCCWYYLQYL